jgi:vitamin B12 transporter
VARNRFHYPTDGSGTLVDANQFHEADALAIGLDAGHRFNQRTELRAQLAMSRNQDHIDDAPDSAADTTGFYGFVSDEDFRRRSIDVRINRTLLENSVFTMGGEIERQTREGNSLAASSFGDFASESDDERSNRAAYAQLLTQTGRLTLQTGVRVDDNEPFGDFFTYRASAGVRLHPLLRVRGSVGTAFKEPRFFEQFSASFGARGNPLLAPERSRSSEIGADLIAGMWSAGVTAFQQTFRDLIQYTFAPVGADSVNYLNVGKVAADGIEVESRVDTRSFSIRGSITLLSTNVEDAGAGNDPLYQQGARLIRRPGQTASLTAQYGTGFTIGGVLSYTGPRADLYYDETFTPARVTLPAYTKLDLTARSSAFHGARAVLKLENALDESYEEIRNFPARGRVVFIGFSLER